MEVPVKGKDGSSGKLLQGIVGDGSVGIKWDNSGEELYPTYSAFCGATIHPTKLDLTKLQKLVYDTIYAKAQAEHVEAQPDEHLRHLENMFHMDLESFVKQ